ncbi:MAG: TetR/AcrR family transcriptional regulator [Eubacteriales bacterium]
MEKNFNYTSLLGEGNPLLKYKELLEESLNEFSKTKFEDASLNDILKRAHMSKGSFYHNFGDKFGLYLALMAIVVKKKMDFFSSEMELKQYSGDFFGTIRELAKATMDFMFVDKRLHDLSNRYMEVSDELKSRIMEFFPYDFNKVFGGLIKSAIESGQIESRFSPDFILKMLEILLTNSYKLISINNGEAELIKTLNELMECMQYGISAKKEEK